MSENTLEFRRKTHAVKVAWGGRVVTIGGMNPIVVQSMTNTSTADVESSVAQVLALARAGSELVRLTVNTPDAARGVARIREALDRSGCDVPLVGDFHYNGHKLLADHPECAAALSKYRINPGNVGKGEKGMENFASMIECAKKYGAAVRIGVNWGSLDQALLARMMDENNALSNPLPPDAVLRAALVESAVQSADMAVKLGLPADRIVLSAKVSEVQGLISVYRMLARRGSYALHLGLTEAGIGSKGIVASTAALAVLLQEGIGDTIRMPEWRVSCPGVENMTVAVMGCVVNGPGESRQADIGISLPGSGESPVAPVYVRGEKVCALKGDDMQARFHAMIEEFVQTTYGASSRGQSDN